MLNHDELRKLCLSFPGVTEDIKWGLSLKCTPEKFDELCERQGIAPAAYVGRYKCARISDMNAVSTEELNDLIATSYALVRDKLSKALRDKLKS